jgi:hypothetical protein
MYVVCRVVFASNNHTVEKVECVLQQRQSSFDSVFPFSYVTHSSTSFVCTRLVTKPSFLSIVCPNRYFKFCITCFTFTNVRGNGFVMVQSPICLSSGVDRSRTDKHISRPSSDPLYQIAYYTFIVFFYQNRQ